MKKTTRVLLATCLVLFLLGLPLSVSEAKQGCCSWHGGVSHCDTSTGRQVCNDGTYSPSCTCTYIPPKPKPVAPTVTSTQQNMSVDDRIKEKINSVKNDYPTHHQGFRERLIKQIVDYLRANEIEVATQVYTILPDIK